MSIRSGYAELTIDYTSLALFWSKLTDEQKKLTKHEQFRYMPEDVDVKTESILIVWSKLTDIQKKLIKSGFFCSVKIKRRVTRSQRIALIRVQNNHEEIVNKELVKKAEKAKKVKKKGSSGGTPPGPKANWHTCILAEKIGHSRCWYTNEECTITTIRSDWQATREHIISQAYGCNGANRNTAIVANFVNNLLGCAPLHVKMHIRNELNKISCLPSVTNEQKKKIYRQIILNTLNQYRVCGSLPWDNFGKVKSAKSLIVEMAYWRHMIIQKNYVDNIQENSNNIRDYLEENYDGMETGIKQAYGLRGNSS